MIPFNKLIWPSPFWTPIETKPHKYYVSLMSNSINIHWFFSLMVLFWSPNLPEDMKESCSPMRASQGETALRGTVKQINVTSIYYLVPCIAHVNHDKGTRTILPCRPSLPNTFVTRSYGSSWICPKRSGGRPWWAACLNNIVHSQKFRAIFPWVRTGR